MTKNRIESLDVLRGITVAAMIIVNNGGNGALATLHHSAWNGLTICDLVFPFFLFMVGVSIAFSLSRQEASGMQPETAKKIIVRSIKMFAIGIGLHWFDQITKGNLLPFDSIRIYGVLQRIAICYLVVSLIFIKAGSRWFIHIGVVLLLTHGILMLTGNGFDCSADNIAARLDRMLIPEAHLYTKSPIDPEGMLGNLSAIAHTMIGVLAGKLIKQNNIKRLAASAVILITTGLILSFIMPINKRVWSPSYTLLTCGIATAMLERLILIVDNMGIRTWATPFRHMGMNAFFVYAVSEMLSSVIRHTGVADAVNSAIGALIGIDWLTSLVYTILLTALMAGMATILARKKIFIKI